MLEGTCHIYTSVSSLTCCFVHFYLPIFGQCSYFIIVYQAPPHKSTNYPSLLFLSSSPLYIYIFFCDRPPVIIGFFSEPHNIEIFHL